MQLRSRRRPTASATARVSAYAAPPRCERARRFPCGDLAAARRLLSTPHRLVNEGGIEPILRGLAAQEMSAIDTQVVDGLRNFLFGPPTAGGLDLASLNIQRGRDHGLPDYASAVAARGLGEITSFDQITSDPQRQTMLAAQYGSVDSIDLWVGGIAEDPVNGGHLGPLFFDIIKTQFESLQRWRPLLVRASASARGAGGGSADHAGRRDPPQHLDRRRDRRRRVPRELKRASVAAKAPDERWRRALSPARGSGS